jgi:ABC-type nitrate/sulfonate/bicarbonate transport system substrate-binding protein
MASQKGVPIKIIMSFTDKPISFLVSQPGKELKDVESIGMGQRFAPLSYMISKFIKENNMSSEVIFLDNEIIYNAQLLNGAVDAIIGTNPVFVFEFQKEGFNVAKIFEDNEMIFGGLVVTNDKIKNNPKEIEKVVKSMQEAIGFIRTNPQETKELLFEYFALEKNEDNKKMVEDTYSIFVQYLLDTGIPKETATKSLIQFVKAGEFESFEDIDNQTVSQEEMEKSFDFRFLTPNAN